MKFLTIIGFILFIIFNLSHGRRYNICSLTKKLYHTYHVPKHEIPDWVCTMPQKESSCDTNVTNRHNSNGSWDWGIFQINDEYWCHNSRRPGKSNLCNINCEQLVSEDITASVRCARIIKIEMGWDAWFGWRRHCRYNKPDITVCFDDMSSGHGYAY